MKNFGWLLLLSLLFSQWSKAQETDSTQVFHLENAVITGQYSPQSVDKSLYDVEVISAKDIKNQAGNTVADVLNQNLNILIVPSTGSGDSTAEMLGLSGSYVKVLVDNIPLVADSGMGNNIDLTKINLDNVERIEIVKGAMGVDYGNNAMAGIINIITKKNIKTDWKINMMIQEETVGKEYDWYEDGGVSKGKGRHIQAVDIGHKLSDKWYISAGLNRNDFQGFWGEKEGRKYLEQNGNRGYEWLPKEQWNGNGLIRYSSKNFSAFYKLSYLHEEINAYDSIVNQVNFTGGERTFQSNDRDYFTKRWTHHLNLNAKLFDRIRFNGDFSYQNQERKFEDFVYDIPSRIEISREHENVYLSTKTFYSRGTFSNFLDKKLFDFQIGYELENNSGFANAFATDFAYGNENVDKEIGTYAGFASAEINTNVGLSFRPGFRASFSNEFKSQFSYSLNTKYNLTEHSNIRAVIGTANRFPDYVELYTFQVDSNHNIQGDPNLIPEKGYSTSIQWSNRTRTDNFKMTNNISTLYLDVDDRIELVQLNPPNATYKFLNIDKFKSWGISTDHQLKWRDLNVNLGASVFGISKSLLSASYGVDNSIEDEYRYTLQVNASVNYTIPNWRTTFSAYYKYNGKSTQYQPDFENSTDTQTVYELVETEGFNMLDASIRKGFYKDRFEVTLGVRNIFDVTNINQNSINGQGHSGGSSDLNLFYGRSYFLKLNYNLEF